MDLNLTNEGHVTVVAVAGNLVIGDAESRFKKTVSRLLDTGRVQLLIDCSKLEVVDSTGLGALVRALTTSQAEGGGAKLLGVGPRLQRLLEMTQLHSVFEIYGDRTEALASFT